MTEYISKEVACKDSFTVYTKEYGSIEVVPVDYIASIEPIDVQPETHWININDRLPDTSNGKVLCEVLTDWCSLTLWCENKNGTVKWTYMNGALYTRKVLYWYPLPQQLPNDIEKILLGLANDEEDSNE